MPRPLVSCSCSAYPCKLNSRAAGEARGGKSPPQSLSFHGHLAEQVSRRRAAIRSLEVEFVLHPLRVSTCHASQGTLEASPAALLSRGCILSCWLPHLGCKFLEARDLFKLLSGSPAVEHGPAHSWCSTNVCWLNEITASICRIGEICLGLGVTA